LGFGEFDFGEPIEWRRDPLSGKTWPLEYHADIQLLRNDGSDVRVLWELNRLSHLIQLGRAFALTGDTQFSEEVFAQLENWHSQNPPGMGPNWSSAMEVALRATNLLGAFALCRQSENLTEDRLLLFLKILDQHAGHIERNLEFSYLGNSNHYLSDLVGLLWVGITLPELVDADKWKSLALSELSSEMDKQVLPDGADHEGSTGYHRYVLELFLYSFILCRENGIELDQNYRDRLWLMLDYLMSYLRPDGSAPLIGDTDGGRLLQIADRAAGDHSYLLPIGAALFGAADFKPGGQTVTEELLWLLGEKGICQYQSLIPSSGDVQSRAFPEAGTYVLRSGDAYLLFNSSNAKNLGRSSHRHNDALSVEVAACGRSFIVDPGTYVYTANLDERHSFRSTAFHSTVQLDGQEQNRTVVEQPFILGNEARARIVEWQTDVEKDLVVGEHSGYERLHERVTHLRSVTFDKKERWWLIEDRLIGTGEHQIVTRFHFDVGLELRSREDGVVASFDLASGSQLLICPLDPVESPHSEEQFSSRHYGAKSPSVAVCWSMRRQVPVKFRWALIPVCAAQDSVERLDHVRTLLQSND
jgi:hypothetical protein